MGSTLSNMRQIEQLFRRVNHNNRTPSYLQQLAHLTESCREWLAGSAGKSFGDDLKNRLFWGKYDFWTSRSN